ncbi:hypothetical protein PRK78_001595 [Emydomyces testavorans]|uniref:J domain-containing protein n=1 Tax=Emydomyces testavorans TaxID=2070801 RepID=A0AAF0DD42_9EURO|nr:hypothetical protein PRK78_001595 [Emydomyces testavorans]
MSTRTDGGDVESHEDIPDSSLLEEEYDRIVTYPHDVDYYSLLALSRDPPPTDAQIRSAYRTLTLSFHPDKQPPHLRDVAAKYYDRIQQAYDTLIDPKKRVVYDMLGEEGVKAEWRVGGAFGRGGEAERNQIGIKAMDVNQFRRWFLRTMKLRELKLVEQMVQSKGIVSIKLNAHGLAMRIVDPLIAPNIPLARISSLALGFNFKTPFAPLRWIQQLSRKDNDDETEEGNEGVPIPNEQDGQLEIHAGVGGKFRAMEHIITVIDPVHQKEETKEVTIPRVLIGENISLGATLRHQFHVPEQKSPASSMLLFPLIGDSLVEVGSSLLPSPAFHTTFSKKVQLVKGTRPLSIAVQGLLSDMDFRSPPMISTSVSRGLGHRSLAYCNWSSGKLSWPSFIQGLFAPLALDENAQPVVLDNPSQFEIGYVALPVKRVQHQPPGADDDDEDFGGGFAQTAADGSPDELLETWGLQLHSSPFSMQLSMNYARNLFSEKVEEAPRSEWSYEGYQPQRVTGISRTVRLEVTTTVGLNQSLGWMVSGSRQVGHFTRMGLAVEVQGGKGLVCSVTWQRLGQTIKLPIALWPVEYLSGDVGVLAVIIPWITYSIVEFGVLRPRERRRQKQALSRERKRLKKLVARRKEESIQAISLMREQVQRRQAREAEKNGLVILEARYGHVPSRFERRPDRDNDEFDKLVDVTIPVAALVDQGQLSIPGRVVKASSASFQQNRASYLHFNSHKYWGSMTQLHSCQRFSE